MEQLSRPSGLQLVNYTTEKILINPNNTIFSDNLYSKLLKKQSKNNNRYTRKQKKYCNKTTRKLK
tara:strand:+ start:1246 stop:1440 length:195 start_codon:yes stop_codon:yes gene_type:complete